MRLPSAAAPTRKIITIAGCALIFLGLLFPAYLPLLPPGGQTVYLSSFLLNSANLLFQEALVALSALVVFGAAFERLPAPSTGASAVFILLCVVACCITLPLIEITLPLAAIIVPAIIIIGIARLCPARARAWLALIASLVGLAALWFAFPAPWQPSADSTAGLGATIFDIAGVGGFLCLLGLLLALAGCILTLNASSPGPDPALA